jgi:hypothetical protein
MFEDEDEYDMYGNQINANSGALSAAQSQYDSSMEDVQALTKLLESQAQRQAQIQKIYDDAATRISAARMGPSRREQRFALAAALAAPTKTGSTWEALSNAGNVLVDYSKQNRAAEYDRAKQIEDLRMRRQMSDLDAQAKRDELIARYGLQGRQAASQRRPIIVPAGSMAIDPRTGQEIARGLPRRQAVQVTNQDGTKSIEWVEDPGYAQPQQQQAIPTISNSAQYAMLPSGAVFKDPQGNTRRKP